MTTPTDPEARARAIMRDLAALCERHGAHFDFAGGFPSETAGWVEIEEADAAATDAGAPEWAAHVRWQVPGEPHRRHVRIASPDPVEQRFRLMVLDPDEHDGHIVVELTEPAP